MVAASRAPGLRHFSTATEQHAFRTAAHSSTVRYGRDAVLKSPLGSGSRASTHRDHAASMAKTGVMQLTEAVRRLPAAHQDDTARDHDAAGGADLPGSPVALSGLDDRREAIVALKAAVRSAITRDWPGWRARLGLAWPLSACAARAAGLAAILIASLIHTRIRAVHRPALRYPQAGAVTDDPTLQARDDDSHIHISSATGADWRRLITACDAPGAEASDRSASGAPGRAMRVTLAAGARGCRR